MSPDSGQDKEIMRYSFLRVFANDRTIDADELQFLEKLALRDTVVDDAERSILGKIFDRVTEDMVAAPVWEEMTRFREKHHF